MSITSRSRSGKGSVLTVIAATGLALIFILAVATLAGAAITGSKHDFSGKGWGSTEICIFCHSPHNAMQNGSVTIAPLWNHTLSTATYDLYTSPTLKETETQPNGPSKLCLSCHDGTVAIDSFGNMTGTNMITGNANIGTNLADDHPSSIRWRHFAAAGSTSHGGAASCGNCHTSAGHSAATLNGTVVFYGSVGSMTIECGSCHEPHNKFPANGKLLREPISGSVLCLWCHRK